MTLSVLSAFFYRSYKEHSRVSFAISFYQFTAVTQSGRSTDIIFAGVILAHTTSLTECDQGVHVTRRPLL